MEQQNKVELIGIIGSIRVTNLSDGISVARFSLATNRASCETRVIETTWHSIVAWNESSKTPLTEFQKGDSVKVVGHIKSQRYTDSNGCERSFPEIHASSVEKLAETATIEIL